MLQNSQDKMIERQSEMREKFKAERKAMEERIELLTQQVSRNFPSFSTFEL